jgi:capsular exopolysaccharide synthesis family protein
MVLAAVIALLLAVLLILGAAYLDDGLKDAEVVREALDLPTLGVVPRMTMERGRSEIYRLTMLLSPQSAAAEAYRRLRTNLEFTSVDKPLKTILITSPSAGDGKTVTAANIAVAYAQADRKVLLVDADLRKPGVHEIFNVGNAQGLSSLLHPRSPSWEKVAVATEVPNLRVLPTGPVPPNPAELIGTQRMRTILAELAEANDIVILDGPPLLPVADGAILSKYADGVVLVVDARKTGRQAGGRAKDVLARAGATMLGVVINRLRAAEMELYPAYYPGR